MVEALQLDLKTAYQAEEVTPEQHVSFERENLRLLQENVALQQENVRLLREVNDMRHEYANMEHQLVNAYHKIQDLRYHLQSSGSLGHIMVFVGCFIAVFLLICYGTGFLDFDSMLTIEQDAPVVERPQY